MSGSQFWSGRRRQRRLIEHGEWAVRTGRPRVLIENPDGADLWAHSAILRDAGYDVAVCQGPSENVNGRGFLRGFSRRDEVEPALCPMLENGRCKLVDGADVIVSSTDLPQSRSILSILSRRSLPALVVEGTKSVIEREAEAIGGAGVIELPVTEQRLLAAVAAALESTSEQSA